MTRVSTKNARSLTAPDITNKTTNYMKILF